MGEVDACVAASSCGYGTVDGPLAPYVDILMENRRVGESQGALSRRHSTALQACATPAGHRSVLMHLSTSSKLVVVLDSLRKEVRSSGAAHEAVRPAKRQKRTGG